MSTPTPQSPDPGVFKTLVENIPDLPAWEAMFIEAEESLDERRPEDFAITDIGRMAWKRLPRDEREEALDLMFLTYWSAMESDRDESARYEREHDMRVLLRSRLDEFEDLAAASIPAPAALVADIAALARQLVGGAA